MSDSIYRSRVVNKALNVTAPPNRPLFMFDLTTIRENMRQLAMLGRKYRTLFVMALKSFPSERVVELAAEELIGFEYSNGQELTTLRNLKDRHLIYVLNRPYFSAEDILSPVSGESIVSLDRGFDPAKIDAAPQGSKFLIRIRSEHHKSFGQTRYGFDPDSSEVPALVEHLKDRFEGFNFHYGSETNSPEDYKKEVSKVINLCRRLQLEVRTLDMGGGIHCLDKTVMGEYLTWLTEQFVRNTRFIFEPGGALTLNAGVLIGKVLNRYQNGNSLNVVSTISPACHLRWADPIIFANQKENYGALDHELNVLAPTCHEADRLRPIAISKSMADSLKIGSSIRFRNISGYSWALNTSFNGVPKASIRFI